MLELKGLSVGYGKTPVLRNVCLSFERGKLCCIIGVNGSGKSTLVKSIAGVLPVMSGEISADGVPLGQVRRVDRAKAVAYLAQGGAVPDVTVEQLVLMGRFPYLRYPHSYTPNDHGVVRDALRTLDIEALADRPLSSLSGGMRQTAYIAMALAQGTDYILLDEPTTYLDVSHQVYLMKTLRRLAGEGRGIVTVMHDLPLALGFADSFVLIQGGHAAYYPSAEALCADGVAERAFGVTLIRHPDGNWGYNYS